MYDQRVFIDFSAHFERIYKHIHWDILMKATVNVIYPKVIISNNISRFRILEWYALSILL